MEVVALLIILAICLYITVHGARDYEVFKAHKKTADRQRFYWKWIMESWVLLGVASVVIVVALGSAENLVRPIVQSGLGTAIPNFVKTDSEALRPFYIGAGAGLLVGLTVTIIRSRKALQRRISGAGNVDALMPRNPAERKLGLVTAVTAGITEELFFRVAIPVVLLGIFHNPSLAISASIALFALGHMYQGWKGVLATGLMGWILTKSFLLSGNILVPIAIHIAIDIWGLVLVPYIADKSAKSAKKA